MSDWTDYQKTYTSRLDVTQADLAAARAAAFAECRERAELIALKYQDELIAKAIRALEQEVKK